MYGVISTGKEERASERERQRQRVRERNTHTLCREVAVIIYGDSTLGLQKKKTGDAVPETQHPQEATLHVGEV